MELRQVETFRAVAEELSFSRAATRLNYVQSSVSAQVAALERELGVPLFDRLGRRIALTDAGVVMLDYARQLLNLSGEARDAVVDAGLGTGEVSGSLTLAAPETLLTYRLPPLLARFHDRYPNVRLVVKPSAIGRLTGSMRRSVEEGRADVAFILDTPVHADGLLVRSLATEDIAVIAPPAHRLVPCASVAPQALADEMVLLPEAPESGCAYRGQFERHLADARVVPRETMEFQSIEAVKQCVAAGMGVSVLPRAVIDAELEDGKIAALTWSAPFAVSSQMVWREDRWRSPAMRAFLETACDVFPAMEPIE